jgi:hypothetical protein
VNSRAQDEITSYVEAVRAALAELPDATRDELLEDLPEHLAEVQAEGTGTLSERLGSPEAYAAELRATASYVGGFPDPPPASQWVSAREVWANVEGVLRRADVRVGPVIGYERVSDFLILLRPAWWVLRGYLAAMAVVFLFDSNRDPGLLPRLGGSTLLSLLLLAGCLMVSITIGKRAGTWTMWPRYALRAGTVLLALFAFGGFLSADRAVRTGNYSDVSSYDGNPYSNVQDVYVYDSQGHLVQGARLFDQDGSQIQLGSFPAYCDDPLSGESTQSHSLGYPYCPQNAPFAAPSAGTPQPSAGTSQPSAGTSQPSVSPTRTPASPGPSTPVGPPATSGSVAPARPSGSPSVSR